MIYPTLPAVEDHRIGGPVNSPNGAFLFSHKNTTLRVIASNAFGWDHVSVSLKTRVPSWDEMCYVKRLFFHPNEAVMQLHPPEDDYVNDHPNVLHLWRPQTEKEVLEAMAMWAERLDAFCVVQSPGVIPLPDKRLV